jgi:hypothetical protein
VDDLHHEHDAAVPVRVGQRAGRIYTLSLDGKLLGVLGESGRDGGQFNWIHGLACPSENVLYVADLNNWRVQKLRLYPERAKPSAR